MENYKINAKDLDITTAAGATRKEIMYAEERAHIELKKKFRPDRGSYPQWAHGAGISGSTKPKAPSRNQRTVQPTHRTVLHVLPTGKRRFEREPL